ncbi:phage portal protein [Streptomyces alfalfae]|uniref:phage portal protein n=1 Tax=Streptomyces alfalfae TaxID=1642299 RepID=UPI0028120245|nr:phage portal protein [Streptomyces alfalfae]
MGVRDRLAKVFGNRVPADMRTGEQDAQMTPAEPFSPGQPIGPYDGFSRQPRSQDFVTGYNIAARPKSHERVSFDMLRSLIDSYDVAQACIWHRIDSIRSLEWSVVPARGFAGNADDAIAQAMAVLEKPDRQTPFANWLAKWLYDVLAFDAGALYRVKNRGGRVIGLRPVDGTSIAPLLDYWGNVPEPPTEAYVQYVNGLPWNWLTRNDLIYEPFRPRTNSPYGVAPLESILLNANTDLRFQAYFLQRFTEGNIPEAFASAPEAWTPEQIDQFQGYWDQLLLGDQAIKHQIKWIPGGSTIAWSNEKQFDDTFSLFLMRKTCAAYHVVPADLGFTESVNRSSGETQADVAHRVGDLPLVSYVQGVLTGFLRHDLGLPVEFKFDTGQEKEDRLAMAQAWEIYIASGIASPDEGREQLLGLPADPERPTPRFYAQRGDGPVPLLAIDGVAGRVDSETFGPAKDQPVLPQPFVPAPSVRPAEGTEDRQQSRAALDAYQDQVREFEAENDPLPAAKDAAPATPTAGVTTQTGIVGHDLIGHDEDDEERVQAAKAETDAFRRFVRARRRDGRWRDFTFQHLPPREALRLNQAGRLTVRKAAGTIAVAGLAVRAADTGRVLMLQRALDPADPAAGLWEFPGGHIEDDETPLTAAVREWSEETGMILPFAPDSAAAHASGTGPTWARGIYRGYVYEIPSESTLNLTERGAVPNPDDPDGDQVEALAWWDPSQLVGNVAVRPELLDSLGDVLTALGVPSDEKDQVGKATPARPKGDAPAQGASPWPGWAHDEECAAYYAQALTTATGTALTAEQAEQLVRDYRADQPQPEDEAPVAAVLIAAAVLWLTTRIDLTTPFAQVLRALYADAYLLGTASAHAILDAAMPDLEGWRPGDTATARRLVDALGDTDDLATLTATTRDVAEQAATSRIKHAARVLVRGLLAGEGDAAIGQAIREALGSHSRARTVSLTETTRASSRAAATVYRRRGVTAGVWLIDPSNPCTVCQANGAASPLPLGAPYPSGDTHPPVHPNCRCALIPA